MSSIIPTSLFMKLKPTNKEIKKEKQETIQLGEKKSSGLFKNVSYKIYQKSNIYIYIYIYDSISNDEIVFIPESFKWNLKGGSQKNSEYSEKQILPQKSRLLVKYFENKKW